MELHISTKYLIMQFTLKWFANARVYLSFSYALASVICVCHHRASTINATAGTYHCLLLARAETSKKLIRRRLPRRAPRVQHWYPVAVCLNQRAS